VSSQKAGAEGKVLVENAADEWCDHGRDNPCHGDVAEHRSGALTREHVAHDGARQDHAGRAADCLYAARHNEHLDGRGKRARHACRHEQRHARHQGRAAAIAVGQRAVDQLAQREACEIDSQGELHDAGRGAEGGLQAGHGRDENVHGQRTDGGHGDEDAVGHSRRCGLAGVVDGFGCHGTRNRP
jgi:hypothetical protein